MVRAERGAVLGAAARVARQADGAVAAARAAVQDGAVAHTADETADAAETMSPIRMSIVSIFFVSDRIFSS